MAAETISRKQRSLIKSLAGKKGRREEGLFLVEGARSVQELLSSGYKIQQIYHTPEWETNPPSGINCLAVSGNEMASVTALSSPSEVLAIAEIPAEPSGLKAVNSIMLDNVRDPGNLGTIIRIADWFGIRQVICSPGTVDLYNPKTIQSTMGSFTRTRVIYMPLKECIHFFRENEITVYAAVLNGDDPQTVSVKQPGVLLLGSESHGISPELEAEKIVPLSIPGSGSAESLNVAVAAGILSYELFRNKP